MKNAKKNLSNISFMFSLIILLCLALASCSKDKTQHDKTESIYRDMTGLSSTVIYSEVLNMIQNPEDYKGDTIKITGYALNYMDDKLGKNVEACVIRDATECCAQGFQVESANGEKLFTNVLEGADITIEGVFDYKDDDEFRYITIKNAKIVN